MNWESIILKSIFLGIPLLLLLGAYICFCLETPLWKMSCKECGKRDWEVVATGHDDFGWQHRCKS